MTGKTAIASTAVVVNTGISESVLAGAVPQSVLAPHQPVPMPEKEETLAGAPSSNLHAATKLYVDDVAGSAIVGGIIALVPWSSIFGVG